MQLVDRIVASRYSLAALSAVTNGGIWAWAFIVAPLAIAEMNEIFVGKYNGAGDRKNTIHVTWQVLIFCLFLFPLFSCISRLTAGALFFGTGNSQLETEYFVTFLDFAPFAVAGMTLNGYFIGTGIPRYVTRSLLIANIINIILDPIFVFGLFGFPSMGCKGAAIATGVAYIAQFAYLLVSFIAKTKSATALFANINFDRKLLSSSLKISLPAAFARITELIAHGAFYRIVLSYGGEAMAIAALAQTFYFFIGCMTEGVSKGCTAIISNLVGAGKFENISSVILAGVKVIALIAIALSSLLLVFHQPIFHLFLNGSDALLLSNPEFVAGLIFSCLWMCVFILGDGPCWIFIGYFSAIKRTKLILLLGIISNWLIYVPVTYVLMRLGGNALSTPWMSIAIYGLFNGGIYYALYLRSICKHQSSVPFGIPN